MALPLSVEQSSMASPSTPSRRLNKKERFKMISQITILDTTMDGKLSVSLKIEDCSFVDDNSLSLLSMPDGPFMTKEPFKPTFHSFVITVQNGQRIYGGSYIFGLRQIARNEQDDEHKVVYLSRALVALTIRPLVNQLKKLLEWCVIEGGCNPRWLRCLANIPLPQKGKCIMLHLPDMKNINKGKQANDEINIVISSPARIGESTSLVDPNSANIVPIFRPFSIFPLFDYSFRYLLTEVITIDNLLWIYACALNELQILISSSSYYKLMLISECITALLNPFKWQHVYVPILPTKLGLHYLDAPTPFIMGINSRHQNYVKTSKIACFVDCDEKRFDLNVDNASFFVPPFIEDLRAELQEVFNSDPRLSLNVPKSDAMKRVSELAHKYNVILDQFTYLDEMKLNQKIRILFFKKLKKYILNKYQHYIALVPGGDREQTKFDSVSYLSDQPLTDRPFLQHFIETQMFATFIDEVGKSLSKNQKNFYSDADLVESINEDDKEEELTIYSDKHIEARFNTAQQTNLIDLEESPASTTTLAVGMSPCRKRIQSVSLIKGPDKSVLASPTRNASTAITAQANWKVVETLLKEVKLKTKRILLVKMGSDEIGSSVNLNAFPNLEENTLIAALCDLIERIWSHARSDDSVGVNGTGQSNNRCPFWSHLTSFHECQPSSQNEELYNHSQNGSRPGTPEQSNSSNVNWLKRRIDSLSQLSLVDQNPRSLLPNSNSSITKSLPGTLSYDFKSISEMTDIKTDVGKSRAFIRLSLERKLLSKHLRALLYNQELLQNLYKRYAFLRCEEEREQFLTHLLTLNAVDLPCFTNTFTTTQLVFTLVIGATVQFNGHIQIVGSHGHTIEPIPIDSNVTTFKHVNFGFISLVSLTAHPSQKVFVENCFIRNNVTNSLYRFECNKWLGRNIDDGSIERLLVAEIVHGTINDHINNRSSHSRSSSIGRNWNRNSESSSRDEKYSIEDLQTMLGESVNQIVKLYFTDRSKLSNSANSETSKSQKNSANLYNGKLTTSTSSATLGKMNKNKSSVSTRSMVSLLFGERKFLWIITQIFSYGFKNRRSFRKQNFIWDFIMRVQSEIKLTTGNNTSQFVQEFISLIDSINEKASNFGKDLKFHLFILLSLRDQKLTPYFLKLLSRAALCSIYYDTESFLRDSILYVFLSQILKSFNEIELKLDMSITKGL